MALGLPDLYLGVRLPAVFCADAGVLRVALLIPSSLVVHVFMCFSGLVQACQWKETTHSKIHVGINFKPS